MESFFVRLDKSDNADVRKPWVLHIFLKICMGAHKHPPKLGYGGCKIKYQYKIFKIRNCSLKLFLTIRKNIDFSTTFHFFVKLDFQNFSPPRSTTGGLCSNPDHDTTLNRRESEKTPLSNADRSADFAIWQGLGKTLAGTLHFRVSALERFGAELGRLRIV